MLPGARHMLICCCIVFIQEIRNKKITREEGVALVKKFDGEFPCKSLGSKGSLRHATDQTGRHATGNRHT
jgi:hypothetical protein